jgi:hypothetical protein
MLTVSRILMHFAIALLVGILYFKIGQDAAYVLDNFNLLFFSIMFLMYSAFSATMITCESVTLASPSDCLILVILFHRQRAERMFFRHIHIGNRIYALSRVNRFIEVHLLFINLSYFLRTRYKHI